MTAKKGSLLGGVLLITGSCVGAGMLGLPVLSGLAGFGPAFVMFCLAWLFMTLTGFLLIEINGWFPKQVNLLSMIEHALGRPGKILCWVIYLFLFYALLVAYIAAIGSLCSTFWKGFFGTSIPSWIGSLFFVLLFGGVVYQGTRKVDLWNRVLMVAKILFFLGLVMIGVRHIEPQLLTRVDWSTSTFTLPILIISFGFHNMIPSLMNYMHGEIKRVRMTVLFGGILAFVIYFIWETLVLGIVPLEGSQGLLEAYREDLEGAQALSRIVPSQYVSIFAQGLAFFAILTSFLAQSLSFMHFLEDGMKVSYKKNENFSVCLLVLLPPLALSMIYPKLFFQALDFAGGICAVLLFGIIPVVAVWRGRYQKHKRSPQEVFGGRSLLVGIFLFALFIFCFQLLMMTGVISGIK